MGSFRLTSPAFADGDPIPRRFGYREENVNPPLDIDGVPANAESLVLLVDDPDAVEPAGKVWSHWVVWNIDPGTTTIPEVWDASGALEGTNDYGTRGYGGPNPPDGTRVSVPTVRRFGTVDARRGGDQRGSRSSDNGTNAH